MTLAQSVTLAALVSIWLSVWSLGAKATMGDALYLLARPRLLWPALAAIFGAAPLFAVAAAAVLPLDPPVKFAIVAMSVAPVPPTTPYKLMKSGAGQAYAVGLLVAATVASLVATPLLVFLAAWVLGASASVSPAAVARTVGLSIALPLSLGLATRALAPRFAAWGQPFAQRAGSLLLLAAFAAMLVSAWPQIVPLIGEGALLAMAATSAAGVIAGHALGRGEDRIALAMAAGSRHPGVALAIAAESFPEARSELLAAVLLYFLVSALITTLYARLARPPVRPAPGPVA
jgi:BASS family bile acid:Na+ symporter